MAFELKGSHFYIGLWRAMMGNNEGDVMAMVWKDEEGGLWHLKIRIRHYKDDKLFESKDERIWQEWISKTGEDSQGQKLKHVVQTLLERGATDGFGVHDIQYIPCNGNGDAMRDILCNPERPGTQWVTLTEQQEEEYRRTDKLPQGVTPKGDV